LWRLSIHVEDIVAEPIDVLGQIRTDAGQYRLWNILPFVLELAEHVS
jgi:hypothetical protein